MEDMKNHNHDQTPNFDTERALWRVDEDQMLQFTADGGFRLFEYVETGETQVQTVRAGESEFVYRLPVKEPVVQKETDTLEEMFEPEEDDIYDDGIIADKIDTAEFKEWVKSLVQPEDVKRAAIQNLERREREGDEQTMACGNCRGEAHFETTCSCTFGGTTFFDATKESEDSTVKLREDGEPDPDCKSCDGTGKIQSDCSCCNGLGVISKYPHLILTNQETGEERVLQIDLPALVAEGEVDVHWIGQEKIYENNYQVADKTILFDIAGWVEKHLSEMGIDKGNSALVDGQRVELMATDRLNVYGTRATWQKDSNTLRAGYENLRSSAEQTDPTADDMIQAAQRQIANAFAWSSKIRDDNGIAIATEWVIRPVRPLDETLEDTKTALANHGYTLGLARSFIGTGESGPAFFILNQDGEALQQLSVEYSLRESIENAWLAFQKIRDKLDS